VSGVSLRSIGARRPAAPRTRVAVALRRVRRVGERPLVPSVRRRDPMDRDELLYALREPGRRSHRTL